LADFASRWGVKDEDAAWKSAAGLPVSLRQPLLHQLVMDRVGRDPKTGLEYALHQPGVAIPYDGSALRGRADLIPLIQQFPESMHRQLALASALAGMPVAGALHALDEMNESTAQRTRTFLLRNATIANLQDVMDYHAQATGRLRDQAGRAIGQALVRKDPARAVQWAQENLSGSIRNDTIRDAFQRLQSKDPAAASAARALLPEGSPANATH
jgi:hypothetical protein